MSATFNEVTGAWLERKRMLVKPSTFNAYQLIVVKHLLPLYGELEAISEEMAQRMVFDKLGSGLSRKSVRDIVAVLKDICKYGRTYMGFDAGKWEISFPREMQARRLPVMNIKDQRKLAAHILAAPDARNIGVLISLCTGMRIGEVCGLQWADVSLSERQLTVARTAGRSYDIKARKTVRLLTSPKTRSSCRVVPLSRELAGAMRTVRKQCPGAVYVVGGGEYPAEPRSYRDSFARLLRRLGIPAIVYHGLRHTFATRCVESGCDIKVVSAILGHSNVATTLNLYVHPDEAHKRSVVERLSKILKIDS